jgi:hypothetical protein
MTMTLVRSPLRAEIARLKAAQQGQARVPVDLGPLWTPRSEPQRLALESEADEVYYGGGKTDLLIGLAITRHRRSVIFRREYAQHSAIIDRVNEILTPIVDRVGYNGTERRWRLSGGRFLELGAAQHEDSVRKWRGRPHDGKFFDELPEFTEAQYLFFSGWARTTVPGQRVRIVGAGNPPTNVDGEWVIERWGAWLDRQHPSPAAPGELRWYTRIDGKDTEVEDGTPFEHNGELLYPRSRTFIPANLSDNPFLSADPAYRATLQGLPEPLRSQLLYGDHTIGLEDDLWQVIPTAWVREAQARWHDDDDAIIPLSAVGVDVAQGGRDATAIARRYEHWAAEVDLYPGAQIPDASVNAELVREALSEGGYAVIDIDGLGAATYHLLKPSLGTRVRPFQGSAPTTWTDKSGELQFANTRAAAWWNLRERLDPNREAPIALPPGRQVLADLTAPRWFKAGGKVQVERKADIKQRLGHSPDTGDALVMAYWDDPDFLYALAIGQSASLSTYRSRSMPRLVRRRPY